MALDLSLSVAGDEFAGALAGLQHSQSQERVHALTVIGEAGDAAAIHIDRILDVLATDADEIVLRQAAWTITKIAKGHEARAALALDGGLDSRSALLRAEAARGLGALKVHSSIAKLGGLLQDPFMNVREAALVTLGQCGVAAGSQAAGIAANIRVPLVRVPAIIALGLVGEAGAAFLADLVMYLFDSDTQVRLAVADALLCMRDYVTEDSATFIAAGLDSHSDKFRASAAVAIGSLGDKMGGQYSKSLVKMLREHTGDGLSSPACGAALGLGRMGSHGDVLAAYLSSATPAMRAAACRGLGEMGKGAASFEVQLVQCLDDTDEGVRDAAKESLMKVRDFEPALVH